MKYAFLAFVVFGVAGCCPTADEIAAENQKTLDWLMNEARTPDCLTQSWPECIRKP